MRAGALLEAHIRVLVASPRGFCAGVDMALAILDRTLATAGPPVYAYHQIVHNSFVVSRYRRLGVVFIDDVTEVPRGGTVVFSAHGVAPNIRDLAIKHGLRVVDATCPLVHKVHHEARRFAGSGYSIILIGHGNHDESVGVFGEAPDSIQLVESVEDVERVHISNAERVAYLTQTTLSLDEAQEIIAALRRRFPTIARPRREDICYATQNRQEAVRAAVNDADVVLVIGSQNSSNSRRLAETAERYGRMTRMIDGADDLDPAWFANASTILVTAGASTPEELVDKVVQWLLARFGGWSEERRIVEETIKFQPPRVPIGSVAALGQESANSLATR